MVSNAVEINFYSDDNWRSIFDSFWEATESLQKLMNNGWKVISINQSFGPKISGDIVYGCETVIIEKEEYE